MSGAPDNGIEEGPSPSGAAPSFIYWTQEVTT